MAPNGLAGHSGVFMGWSKSIHKAITNGSWVTRKQNAAWQAESISYRVTDIYMIDTYLYSIRMAAIILFYAKGCECDRKCF